MLEANLPDQLRKAHAIPYEVSPHAYGLLHPSHMEWTTDGRLLVSEFGGGRIIDITEGGDYRNATAQASGLQNPAGICTTFEGDRVVVADTGRSQIIDITEGGEFAGESAMAAIPGVYGLVEREGTLHAVYATETENGVAVAVGETFTAENIHFGGFPNGSRDHPSYLPEVVACPSNWAALAFDQERMLYVHSGLGAIYDVSNPGTFGTETSKFAEGLNRPLGMTFNPTTNLLYVAERGTGSIKPMPQEGGLDMRFVPPVATGFRQPSCLRFSPDKTTMYVCDMADNVVWRVRF
jgi:DNA-binding beta-propeller fold protein YncE